MEEGNTEEKIAEKLPPVDLSKLTNPLFNELIAAGLINDQGIRISGIGMVVRKLEVIWKQLDRNGLKLHKLQKDMETFVKLRS